MASLGNSTDENSCLYLVQQEKYKDSKNKKNGTTNL
jgi:hypothetical protein